MSRREARRRERRDAIEQQALALVRDNGVESLTMPGLAKALGCAVGALYRYYSSKEELVLALQLRAVDAFHRMLAERLSMGAGDPPLAQLRRAMGCWGAFTVEEPELYELLQVSIAHPKVLLDDQRAAEVAARFEPMIQRCAGLLERAVDEGSLRPGDAEVRVWVMWGAVSGIGQFRKQDHRRPPPLRADALVEQAIDSLLVGWQAPG